MKITIKIKNVYGNDLIYPACEKSRIFSDIAGKKTLSRADLKLIVSLGYEIVVESANLTL